jgi:hypothetical protein
MYSFCEGADKTCGFARCDELYLINVHAHTNQRPDLRLAVAEALALMSVPSF